MGVPSRIRETAPPGGRSGSDGIRERVSGRPERRKRAAADPLRTSTRWTGGAEWLVSWRRWSVARGPLTGTNKSQILSF